MRSPRVSTPSWSRTLPDDGDRNRDRAAVPAYRRQHGGILDAVDPPEPVAAPQEPVLPAYGGGCVADIVPSILETGLQGPPGPLPPEILEARAVVVLVLDGLGAEQLSARPNVAPTLNEMHASTITTVAPSTTASALTSIATGVGVGEHGIVGYRIPTRDGNLNVLRWRTPQGEAVDRHPPERFQPVAAFGGQRPPALQRDEYRKSGFSRAYLGDARRVGYKMLSSLAVEARRLVAAGESFVYAYYEGLDIVAHEHAFGEHYEAELRACDRLMADLLTVLPRGTAVVATSDHGLVDCSKGLVRIDRSVLDCASAESGEARFRWLHARPGRAGDLYEAAAGAHSEHAWVLTATELIDGGWLGPVVTDAARSRLGDVALVARGAWAFSHPDDGKPKIVGRHGSLTSAEMLVPLLVHAA
ncbi:MAG: alkaline phosphatase family protein [Acidimicrobiaceae bacterium]|nr:alkaline phosphatase family protein [Acidimicrobiaceae bacterium]MXZ98263.1 alkaline phosphatase family protein [Acidimicrobiaceae bacterium]MYE75138.1 alkaline phosphatase family protein [Acidimicrobiaceae bacterium]MYE96378.1 alkaline phosphatase family protein [Acidimicrobiaceae bacterium]MYH42373.1 alkaline phosphatase family protein [Acidimicrobiaceae bacterium]